jgi:hypothetical protein
VAIVTAQLVTDGQAQWCKGNDDSTDAVEMTDSEANRRRRDRRRDQSLLVMMLRGVIQGLMHGLPNPFGSSLSGAVTPTTRHIYLNELERAGKPRRPRMSKIMSKIKIKFLCVNEMEGFFAPCRCLPGYHLCLIVYLLALLELGPKRVDLVLQNRRS